MHACPIRKVEPNDPTRSGQAASERFRFGPYEAYAAHTKSGECRWRVVDVHCFYDWERPFGEWVVRSGESFEDVTRDFADLLRDLLTNGDSCV